MPRMRAKTKKAEALMTTRMAEAPWRRGGGAEARRARKGEGGKGGVGEVWRAPGEEGARGRLAAGADAPWAAEGAAGPHATGALAEALAKASLNAANMMAVK